MYFHTTVLQYHFTVEECNWNLLFRVPFSIIRISGSYFSLLAEYQQNFVTGSKKLVT